MENQLENKISSEPRQPGYGFHAVYLIVIVVLVILGGLYYFSTKSAQLNSGPFVIDPKATVAEQKQSVMVRVEKAEERPLSKEEKKMIYEWMKGNRSGLSYSSTEQVLLTGSLSK